jgi:hypothetical protein
MPLLRLRIKRGNLETDLKIRFSQNLGGFKRLGGIL